MRADHNQVDVFLACRKLEVGVHPAQSGPNAEAERPFPGNVTRPGPQVPNQELLEFGAQAVDRKG